MDREVIDERSLPEKKKRGCFFYGCLTFLAVIALFFLLSFLLLRKGFNEINSFTSGTPGSIGQPEYTDEELLSIRDSVEVFRNAVRQDTASVLILTEKDVNVLADYILRQGLFPDLPEGAGALINLEGGSFKARISLPLSRLPFFKKRFLNADLEIGLSVDGGEPVGRIEKIDVNGRSLPKEAMLFIRQANIFAPQGDCNESHDIRNVRIRTLKIEEGKLLLER
ncbi:MAG: hypothetical protein PHQ23_11945 [Candidatus Wallbacteria bacterium]|nr:hypothetical protein [Candidatus Wallbacteria bacterium]